MLTGLCKEWLNIFGIVFYRNFARAPTVLTYSAERSSIFYLAKHVTKRK
jgi:hypothetical protein